MVPHSLGRLAHLQAHGPVNVHAVGGLGAVGGDVVIQALLLGHQGILDHLDGIAEVGGQLLQGGGDLGKSGGGQAQQEAASKKAKNFFMVKKCSFPAAQGDRLQWKQDGTEPILPNDATYL